MSTAIQRPSSSAASVNTEVGFRDHVFRSLLDLTERYQQHMMAILTQQYGHELRLSYQAVITCIPEAGIRPSDIAAGLGMKKQNAGQLLKQLEAAGYIAYAQDPDDGRARLVRLSQRGKQLIGDGLKVAAAVDQSLAERVGQEAFKRLCAHAGQLVNMVRGADKSVFSLPGGVLISDLIVLSDYVMNKMFVMLKQRGHPHFKQSFRPVMMHVGAHVSTEDARISTIARRHEVSKQAVASVTAEMEQLGYLELVPDPDDRRSKLIRLAARGNTLVEDALAVGHAVAGELENAIGEAAFQDMAASLRKLNDLLPEGEAIVAVEDAAAPAPSSSHAPLQALFSAIAKLDEGAGNEQEKLLEPLPGKPGQYRLKAGVIDQLSGAAWGSKQGFD